MRNGCVPLIGMRGYLSSRSLREQRVAGVIEDAARRGLLSVETLSRGSVAFVRNAARLRSEIDSLAARKAEIEAELPPSLVAVTTQTRACRCGP